MRALGIVGTGLIGASIGLRARHDGTRVLGFDADENAAAAALALGAIDETVERERLYRECSVVVIATPPRATCEELTALRGRAPAWDVLLDVASVKRLVVASATGVGNFVASHPLAGSEGSGPQAARADLFAGRRWAYVPSGDEKLDARLREFISRMGADSFPCDGARHDRIVAVTSHVPQLAARLAARRIREIADDYEQYCGPAARELLRLSRSPEALWDEILAENAVEVKAEGTALAQSILAACRQLGN